VFIEGGGRIFENGLDSALPEPEGVVIEVWAEDLGAVEAEAADAVDTGPVVVL
jgi:hypothetical protein